MSDLVEFYRARLDEDEQIARRALAVAPTPWTRAYGAEGGDQWLDIHAANEETVVDTESGANGPSAPIAEHIFHNDPARVLRKIEAQRRIIQDYLDAVANCPRYPDGWDMGRIQGLETAMQILTLPYADHPDYDESWRP